MSVREKTFYGVECDWPDCGFIAGDEGEYQWWAEQDHAIEQAGEWDWWMGADGAHHYCSGHPTLWASDRDDLGDTLEPPYLLIHDGDTDNRNDDGRVTLIASRPDPATDTAAPDEGNQS